MLETESRDMKRGTRPMMRMRFCVCVIFVLSLTRSPLVVNRPW